MADRIFASNDGLTSAQVVGYEYEERVFHFSLARESSVHGSSATLVPVAIVDKPGRIVDFYIGVVSPALSASGFVSANISADVRINSAVCCSTQPQLVGPVGSSAQFGRQATNTTFTSAAGKASPVSAVINSASAAFSAGDQISIDYNLVSGGSAAAGAAGTGLYAAVKVRYNAR
jgi:hypothetical protein